MHTRTSTHYRTHLYKCHDLHVPPLLFCHVCVNVRVCVCWWVWGLGLWECVFKHVHSNTHTHTAVNFYIHICGAQEAVGSSVCACLCMFVSMCAHTRARTHTHTVVRGDTRYLWAGHASFLESPTHAHTHAHTTIYLYTVLRDDQVAGGSVVGRYEHLPPRAHTETL
jgi:hypothetical protein